MMEGFDTALTLLWMQSKRVRRLVMRHSPKDLAGRIRDLPDRREKGQGRP